MNADLRTWLPETGRVKRGLAGLLSVTTLAAVTVSAVVFAGPSSADTSPAAGSGLPTTVTAESLPTVQIGTGVVWSETTVDSTVYAAGNFNTARPSGVAEGGAGEVARGGLVAFDITTGVMTSWNHNLNGAGRFITVSPDKSTLYLAGDFTTVDGQARPHIAAFDLTNNGALKASFAPTFDGTVLTLAVTNSTVYAGGAFTTVNGQTGKSNYVSLSAANGATNTGFAASTAYVATANAPSKPTVTAITLSPDASTLLVAGRFDRLNGVARVGIGGVNATTGAVGAWNASFPIRDNNAGASFTALRTFDGKIYGSGYTTGFIGNFEGTVQLDQTGNIGWLNSCHGDTYDVFETTGVLYTASHEHDCSDIGAWEETTPRIWHRANATTADASPGCVLGTNDNYNGSNSAYYDYSTKNPAITTAYSCATLLPWDPDFSAGTFTGASQGPWATSGNADYVTMGGEFPTVNGQNQYGLARFAKPSLAPKLSGPIALATLIPNVTTPAPGTAKISWKATWDRDNENLTYKLYRGSSFNNLIYQVTTASRFWDMPNMGFTDTGQPTNTLTRYHVTVLDPDGNTINAGTNAGNVLDGSSNSANPYYQDVLADGANNYWRLDQATGSMAVNSVSSNDMVASSGVTPNVAGALTGDTDSAVTFDGTAQGYATSQTRGPAPSTFTEELWFKTTTTKGGRLMGFGSANAPNGISANQFDRQVYMDGAGHLTFGVNTFGNTLKSASSSTATVTSSGTFNNGAWHHVVATVSSSGLALYVDGTTIGQKTNSAALWAFPGYWRIGGDNLEYWPNTTGVQSIAVGDPPRNTSPIAATIDEVATYPTALSLATVQKHYADGSHTAPANVSPTASFTTTVSGLTVSSDASASADSDGSIASYAWTYGDNSPAGTGKTNDHTYTAAGTYTVTLTVTDNAGATGTTTRLVTVATGGTTPAAIAADSFERTASNGWGNADTGGAWFVSSASSFSVSGGQGQLSIPTGSTRYAYLNSVASTDTDVQVTVKLSKMPSGGGTYVNLVGRTISASTGGDYRVKVLITSTGAVSASLIRSDNARTETVISPAKTIAGLTYTSGSTLRLRLQVTGTSPTTLNASVWTDGTTEPSAFQITGTDNTTGLQVPGGVGVLGYISGSTTTTPTILSFDTLTATSTTAPGGGANVAPTASFTATPAGLTVSTDASASADPDGSIASYAWDYGDTTPAQTGKTDTHTYTAAGTYTITLTVTDNAGAIGTTTRTVTVTAGVTTLASDDFTRTSASAWGTAPTGGAWTVAATSAFSVNGSAGVINQTAGTTFSAYLNSVSSNDTDVRFLVADNKVPTGGGTYITVAGRKVAGQGEYRAKVQLVAGGVVKIQLIRANSTGTETAIGTAATVTGLSYTAGMVLQLRMQVTGINPTTFQAKVWNNTTAEPGSWQVTTTDSTTGLQTAGSIGLLTYASGSTTNAPQSITVDTLRATTTAPAAPNVLPTAAFTSSVSGATASFNAGGSSDSDGTIASYAWTFGDGTTGTGVTTSHAYTVSNTYTVTLTVTDNRGGTGSTTGSVAVTVPAGPAPFAADDFGRTASASWGSAAPGGAWTVSAGANFSVNGSAGVINQTAGASSTAYLNSVSSNDTDVQFSVAVNKVPTGGGTYITVAGRKVAGQGEYRAKVQLVAGGAVKIQLIRSNSSGTETAIGTAATVSGVTYTAGMVLQLRMQVWGVGTTTFRAKVWTGLTEPTAWPVSSTDATTGLQAAGSIGLITYASGSTTNAPQTITIDGLKATASGN
ncbi:MAG: hypothetical protein JWM76_2091 [Pseudonocardiales bacterium]|nr:hypothetical protein [Pseudonocardiales bacterium]